MSVFVHGPRTGSRVCGRGGWCLRFPAEFQCATFGQLVEDTHSFRTKSSLASRDLVWLFLHRPWGGKSGHDSQDFGRRPDPGRWLRSTLVPVWGRRWTSPNPVVGPEEPVPATSAGDANVPETITPFIRSRGRPTSNERRECHGCHSSSGSSLETNRGQVSFSPLPPP